ncbi:MAG: TPM domain-containing protein [Deltaproteobacteria bacterium]|jgi:uncharacterized membrane protein YgcG|nr:TPM domain-containing protein [Deltaproteobacteria bacterium]
MMNVYETVEVEGAGSQMIWQAMQVWLPILRKGLQLLPNKAEILKPGSIIRFATVLLLGLFLLLSAAGCKKKPSETLARDGWITDYAGILSQADESRMSAALEAYEKETCHHVLVLIIQSLAGETIKELSQRTAKAWDIGQEGFGNGILLTIAMQEGSIRLETASAFDWFLEKGISDRVLNEVMIPHFKQERFVYGIEQGVAEIMQAARLKVIPRDHRPDVCRK